MIQSYAKHTSSSLYRIMTEEKSENEIPNV